MALHDVVDGIYRKVAKKYDPVEGVYRKVQKEFDPVDGVYRQYFSGGTPISSLAVGDSVWLNVDGVQTEFLVVHQGNPDSYLYDESCNGTWLLMKDIYENRIWDSSSNDYANSEIHSYLNGTFLGMFDSSIQAAIKNVKIPSGPNGSVSSGANGLSTKIFLLSGYEVGWTTSTDHYFPVDGACISYFSGTAATDTKRIGHYEGTATVWWLRSPRTFLIRRVAIVNTNGYYADYSFSLSCGVRPALILNSNTPIDPSTHTIIT